MQELQSVKKLYDNTHNLDAEKSETLKLASRGNQKFKWSVIESVMHKHLQNTSPDNDVEYPKTAMQK